MARKRSKSDGEPGNQPLRFPPERILRFLQQLRGALSLAEGRTVSLDYLEELTGRSAATIRSWCDGVRMQQLEFLFSLIERLPQRLRHDLVDQVCRVTPSLSHPKLAHDPIAVSRLKDVLAKSIGFTAIQGEPGHMRSFVLNALGNSFHQNNPEQSLLIGFEVETISDWATIAGMRQASRSAYAPQILHETRLIPGKMKDATLVLLGGQWNRNPELQSEILELGKRCHVLITDMSQRTQEMARHLHLPLHVVTVAPAREQPEWIRVIVSGGRGES